MNLIENIIRQTLLLEGRLEDVLNKYVKNFEKSDYPNLNGSVTKQFLNQIVYLLSEKDPSGNNKYLDWMVKQFLKIANQKKILASVIYFHENQQSFTKKDINQYETLQELIDAVDEVKLKKYEKRTKKDVDKIYEDENYLILSPKSWEASCVYGAGTKWCITAKDSDHHWKRETSNAIMYFIIDKNKTKDDNLYKVALQYFASDKKIFWDAEDKQITFSLPKNIEELINKHKEENLEYVKDGELYAIIEYTGGSDDETYQTGETWHGLWVYEDDYGYYVAANRGQWDEIVTEYTYDLIYDEEEAEHFMEESDYEYYTYVSPADIRMVAGEEARYIADELEDEELIERGNIEDEINGIDEELSELVDREYELVSLKDSASDSKLLDIEKEEKEIRKRISNLETEKERFLEGARDDIYDEVYDEWKYGLEESPTRFLVDELGHYETYKEAYKKVSWIGIDLEKFIESYMEDVDIENVTGYSYETTNSSDADGKRLIVSKIDY
jgi:hypothetical protein